MDGPAGTVNLGNALLKEQREHTSCLLRDVIPVIVNKRKESIRYIPINPCDYLNRTKEGIK